ncbi:WbqC family protein [Massilia sp. GCM10020059]|uniref:WbqC family protein n=1 Tax=Massilia agrisoli TaxID=2892444 RepID=A0ABS8INP4_9BURK|nr:WbqC family protein [Massilia agrisoli]MCC6069960.1 WbqC family protein [Massilia agrisoli]
MKLAIMQPYFVPYIGYFQLMAAVDRFVLFDDVSFINRGWINRNRILVGGREHLVTIPLRGASQNQQINQIALSDDAAWPSKLLKTIEQSYRKAPFYAETMPLVQDILSCPETMLAPYLRFSLTALKDWLELPCQIIGSSAQYENKEYKGARRILDICRQEQASVYVNAPGGKDLYAPADFAALGMQLRFLKPRLEEYAQGGAPFMPGLSIIDALMYQGRAAARQALFAAELE